MSNHQNIRDCSIDKDVGNIQRILNDAIENSTALYDYKPRSYETVRLWVEQKQAQGLPLRGAYDQAGNLVAFATFGSFRPHPAYKYSVEHSVYVDLQHRRKGLARALMADLIEQAVARDLHVMIGCIDAQNEGSIALHEEFGFQFCGTIKQVGFKFGRWLDASFYQKLLQTPEHPIDG